jgi:branched-subunit amino acid aminotransferase/4-amino-4-deoxychorismate lyase
LKNTVHVAIAAWDWGAYFGTDFAGLKLMWSDWTRPAPNMAPVRAKANGQYITGMISKNKAEKLGYHDALMLDYRGYLAECTGANVFMVKDGAVHTPIADCFLNGITRLTVIDLLAEHGIPCEERHIKPEELLLADEIFVTGSAAEVQPVGQIVNKTYPVGPVTQKMMKAYRALVTGEAA